jgi:hypothetical protein
MLQYWIILHSRFYKKYNTTKSIEKIQYTKNLPLEKLIQQNSNTKYIIISIAIQFSKICRKVGRSCSDEIVKKKNSFKQMQNCRNIWINFRRFHKKKCKKVPRLLLILCSLRNFFFPFRLNRENFPFLYIKTEIAMFRFIFDALQHLSLKLTLWYQF